MKHMDIMSEISLALVRARASPPPIKPPLLVDFRPTSQTVPKIAADTYSLRNTGWRISETTCLSIQETSNWSRTHRSIAVRAHSFEPFFDLLRNAFYFNSTEDLELIDNAISDWIDQYGRKASYHNKELDRLAWYDMASSNRLFMFCAATLCRTLLGKAPETKTLNAILDHFRFLLIDTPLNNHSNHGIYQRFGILAALRCLNAFSDLSAPIAAFEDEVDVILDRHIAPSGCHLEHSPGYQAYLLNSLINAVHTGLLTALKFQQRISHMSSVMATMVKPDFRLATLGDTDSVTVDVSQLGIESLPNDTRYLLSKGRVGATPGPNLIEIRDAGYFGYRDHTVNTGSCYLLQQLGHHSNVHKHCDDLSFIYFDRGSNILIDPGRFGYWGNYPTDPKTVSLGFKYDDPTRMFIETPRAHNTIEVDGRPYSRRTGPSGCSYIASGVSQGVVFGLSGKTFDQRIRIQRALFLLPGQFLVVVDSAYDRMGDDHVFRQWFQIDASFILVEGAWVSNSHTLFISQPPSLKAKSFSERGRKKPMIGWVSPSWWKIEPSNAFWLRSPKTHAHTFFTVFSFDAPANVSKFTANKTLSGISVALEHGSKIFDLNWREGKFTTNVKDIFNT